MSTFAAATTNFFLADDDTVQVRLRPSGPNGDVSLQFNEIDGAREIEAGLVGDPALVLRKMDEGRQLVIDHLVETVGVPAIVIAERQLLADILREVGADLPSPLSHRIRSVLKGDEPERTGRTTVVALAERRSGPSEPKVSELQQALADSVAAAKTARARHPQPAGGA